MRASPRGRRVERRVERDAETPRGRRTRRRGSTRCSRRCRRRTSARRCRRAPRGRRRRGGAPRARTRRARGARACCPRAAASSRSRTSPLRPLMPGEPRLRRRARCAIASGSRPRCFITNSAANTSRSPTRLLCGTPDCGDMPKLVSTATPSRMPATLELPPRWQEMWRTRAARAAPRPLGGGPVAGAVEPVAADAELLASTRTAPRRSSRPRACWSKNAVSNSATSGVSGSTRRKDRIAATYGGLCAGARNVERLHRRQHLVVDEPRAADAARRARP